MKLTKEECLGALCVFKYYAIGNHCENENVKSTIEHSYNKIEQLIEEYFDNQFLDGEIELMISLLRQVEDELGMDITLLIDKLMRIQNTLPEPKGVVTCVEFEID